MNQRPKVSVVDDEADLFRNSARTWGVDAEFFYPDEVDEQTVASSDLVIVDYFLDDWDPEGSLAQRPRNGKALAAVLRSGVEGETGRDHPVAFALWSGRIQDIAGQLPADMREHALARIHDLEWVFPKGGAASSLGEQFASLGQAVQRLPYGWNLKTQSDARELVYELLRLPTTEWDDRAFRDVLDCRPPLYELSRASHGLAFLRWMLHRILPYPCFLLSERYLANTLRISPGTLRSELAIEGSRLVATLEEASYRGILDNFLGHHWWRAGIEAILRESTDGRTRDIEAFSAFLNDVTDGRVTSVEAREPVVCVSSDYRISEELVEIEAAVRVAPDDWPAFADAAWARLDDAANDATLAGRVIAIDRDLLPASPDNA